jgi:Methyltransferase FkbM domain
MNGFSDIVTVHQSAAFDVTGQRPLHLGATNGHHSLFSSNAPNAFEQRSVEVSLVKLDERIASDRVVTLIKIDAEGAELEVIAGGAAVIQRDQNIALIVEFGPSHIRRAGHTTKDWLDMFSRFGFIFRAVNPDSGALEELPIEALEQMDSVNLFLAREGSRCWDRAQS